MASQKDASYTQGTSTYNPATRTLTQTKEEKPKVYYSSVQGWKPSTTDSNYVVVYTNKAGTTTGNTSMGSNTISQGIRTQDTTGTEDVGSALAKSITITKQENIPSGYQGVTTKEGTVLEKIQTKSTPSILQQSKLTTSQDYINFLTKPRISNDLNLNRTTGTISNIQPSMPIQRQEQNKPLSELVPYSTVNKYNLPLSEKIEYNINKNEMKDISNQNYLRLIGSGGLAFGYGFVKTVIQTPGALYRDVTEFPSNPGGVIERNTVGTFTSISQGLRTSPFETLGSITAIASIGKIAKTGLYKTSDFVRTAGLKELPSSDVIAPEYPIQRYPQISKGQTAGQLLGEFKEYGYTASPSPIKASKGVMEGSSELKGLYQAPKLSPTFLKLSGEGKQGFTLNPFESLRPTASRVYPTSFELAEGVKPSSQVNPSNLPKIKQFFETSAEKGKSYVPFIKSEKESVIPFDTGLTKLKSKEYFKFEGRRIPIQEFKTNTGKTVRGSYTAEDLGSRGSSYSLSSSRYSPSDLPLSFGYSKSSSSGYSFKSSSYSPSSISSSFKPINYSRLSYSTSKSFSPSRSKSTSSKSYSQYSNNYISSSNYYKSIVPKIYTPKKPSIPNDSLGKIFKYKSSKVAPNRLKYTPSYESLVFNIKGKMPKGIETGARKRPIPKGFTWSYNQPKLNFKGDF